MSPASEPTPVPILDGRITLVGEAARLIKRPEAAATLAALEHVGEILRAAKPTPGPAQARGGAARARADAVAVPRDRKLAALTLMRMTEIRLLRREDVHLEQGVILLPKAKAGARPVILSDAARKILRRQLESHAFDAVFPRPDGRPYGRSQIGKVFRKASRDGGLKDFHFHDLRHHGATMALNKGFTAPIVMALGGWKTERMMRRYAAVTDAMLRAAAEAVSGAEVGPGHDRMAAAAGSRPVTY